MTRAELEAKIADYLDGTLNETELAAFEHFLPLFPDLAEFVHDAEEGMDLLSQAEAPEPPAAFYARLDSKLRDARRKTQREKRNAGLFAGLAALFAPVLQPRFVMGMAMTILSVSMVGQLTGTRIDQVTADDLKPAAIVSAIGYRAERTWDRIGKYYESLRVVYEMRTRVQEWKSQLDQERERAAARLNDADTEVVHSGEYPISGTGDDDKQKDKLKD